MKSNVIDGSEKVGNVVSVRQRGFFRGKTINNPRGGFGKLHMPRKLLLKTLKRLFSALAMAEMIHAAFHKTPEEIRLEAIKQDMLQQEDMLREVSC
ncbi:MAG: hypothetical protein LBK24_00905 [Puniceicoccales bacterium]|jgi:hypothetical protein|nr:hypothetical protein [Puniceicoccales bacterium]